MTARLIHCLAPDRLALGGGAPLCAPESFRLKAGLTEDPRRVTCPKCLEWLCEMPGYYNLLLARTKGEVRT
jgi:hypothetical protein